MNLTLPNWVKDFYPKGKLLDATKLWYETFSKTDYQRRINGGKLLRAMIDDMESVKFGNGTRKISLYSGHETNVAAVAQTLGVYKFLNTLGIYVPPYSSGVIVEFYEAEKSDRKKKSKNFVKVYYYYGDPADSVLVTIPQCKEECPYETFLKLLEKVIPTEIEMPCDKSGLDLVQTPLVE